MNFDDFFFALILQDEPVILLRAFSGETCSQMHFDDLFFCLVLILSSAGLQAAQAARSGCTGCTGCKVRLHRLQGQAAQAARSGLQLIFGARHGRGITVLTEVTSTKHGRGITVLTTLLPQNLASGISVLMVVRGGVINCWRGLVQTLF